MLSRRFLSNFPLSIKTPQLRDRKFEKLKLENGLSAFLISDPNTTNVSAALSCDVGSWNDGKFAGTAHFLEHMLFLGTKKYPSPNDYEQFIFDNGGSLNGYTANDHSLYYFNHLSPNSLFGGLDRFSRFFHEPLFDPTCVERERNAVHEEYKKNIESDGWRILHVKKELAHQSHPISQFNTGNLDTMTFSREYLMDWYKKNYSAEKMNLVVLGKESLSELSLLATDLFSGIPKRNTTGSFDLPRKIWDSLKGQVVWIETIKDIRELSLSWEIAHSFIDLSTKTASVLSGIIGHEGRQSILHFLKEKGWAEGLSAGPEHHGLQNASFTISISLTKEGIRNWKDVVEIVNEYLQKLSSVSEVPLFLFEESNKMSKIAFEFQQRNADVAITYCEALRKEQIETFPLKSMLISEFDQNAVLKLLTSMTLKDCHICVATKETPPIPLENQEKWMFAKYSVFPFKLNSIDDKIDLPARVKLPNQNIFIPSNLDLVKGNDESIPDIPVSLRETKDISLYYYPDKEFQVPESYYHIRIKSAVIKPNDPESIVLANLYLRFVFEELNPVAYDSSSAGLHYNITLSKNNSIAISVNGYSEKSILLLEKLLQAMKNVKFEKDKFEIFQNSLLRKYQNSAKNSPIQQSYEILYKNLLDHYCSNSDLASAVSRVSLSDLENFKSVWFRERRVEAFVGGNVEEKRALEAIKKVEDSFPGVAALDENLHEANYVPLCNTSRAFSKSFDVSGNALVLTIDAGKRMDELRCHWGILSSLLQEPFYTELRTNQQTGYIVNCSASQIKKHLFINAIIQSNKYDPRDLLSRVELFFEQFLREMDSEVVRERFEKIRESNIQKLETPFDALSSKMDFYKTLTFEEDNDYALLQRRLEILKKTTFEDVKKTSIQILGMNNRKRLAILATGKDKENQEYSYQILDRAL